MIMFYFKLKYVYMYAIKIFLSGKIENWLCFTIMFLNFEIVNEIKQKAC